MSVDPAALITAIGTLLVVVFGYLKQRGDLKMQAEALANERKAREDAEKKAAKKDDLDALRKIITSQGETIDELQERLQEQSEQNAKELARRDEQHARDRAQWESELLSVRQLHAEEREQWRKEREQWRIDKAEFLTRIRQLEGNRRGLS